MVHPETSLGLPRVNVVVLGSAADAIGFAQRAFPIESGETLAGLWERMIRENPRVAAIRPRMRCAVNQRYATDASALSDGDEVALIPPVSGG